MNADLFDLSGRVAIVTGGSSGIGKAIAAGLARYGAKVVITSRNIEKCEAAIKELQQAKAQVIHFPADVSRPDQVKNMVERAVNLWGRLDILINSAGIYKGSPAMEMTAKEWRKVMAVYE